MLLWNKFQNGLITKNKIIKTLKKNIGEYLYDSLFLSLTTFMLVFQAKLKQKDFHSNILLWHESGKKMWFLFPFLAKN